MNTPFGHKVEEMKCFLYLPCAYTDRPAGLRSVSVPVVLTAEQSLKRFMELIKTSGNWLQCWIPIKLTVGTLSLK